MRRACITAATLLFCAIALPAWAASSPPPAEFAGVPIGASLEELKRRHPEVVRNPDSDKQYQVYQTVELKGVTPKSAVAFDISDGRVVGAQVMMDQYNAKYWYQQMLDRYGKPDSCTYCEDAELVTATWMWGNGVRLRIAGEMLTLSTEKGASARQLWLARGDSSSDLADYGDEASDAGAHHETAKHAKSKKAGSRPTAVASNRRQNPWVSMYQNTKDRMSHWFGWSK